MDLLLVRHGHAGSKRRWHGDDRRRPLSRRGRAQAKALVGVLAPRRPASIVSSPYLRCLQTVEPLAERLGVAVAESESLGPDAGREAGSFLRALSKAAADATVVVCTHGETIEVLQRDLGSSRATPFAPGSPHEKGSVWILETVDTGLASALYLPARAVGRRPPRDRV